MTRREALDLIADQAAARYDSVDWAVAVAIAIDGTDQDAATREKVVEAVGVLLSMPVGERRSVGEAVLAPATAGVPADTGSLVLLTTGHSKVIGLAPEELAAKIQDKIEEGGMLRITSSEDSTWIGFINPLEVSGILPHRVSRLGRGSAEEPVVVADEAEVGGKS